MPFHPSSPEIVHVSYGASSDAASGSGDKASSYLDMASQYAPILKTFLFDEDPRIEYEKKSKELASSIAAYKKTGAGFAKNALASKIRSLQAEVSGLADQAETLRTSETLVVAGKATALGLLVAGVGVTLLVGYLFYEKAATERARRHQIASGRMGA